MMLNFIFLSNLIIGVYSAECNESSLTVKVVKKCPMTAIEWMQHENVKKCFDKSQNCTSKENFKYHCVRNSLLTKFIEVCAPVRKSAGYCVEFDEKGKVIQDNYLEPCTSIEPICPVGYLSTQVYKYPKCYVLKTDPNEDNDSNPYSNGSSGTDNAIDVLLFVGIAFLLLMVFLLVSVAIRYRKKKKGLTSQSESPPLEMDNIVVNIVDERKISSEKNTDCALTDKDNHSCPIPAETNKTGHDKTDIQEESPKTDICTSEENSTCLDDCKSESGPDSKMSKMENDNSKVENESLNSFQMSAGSVSSLSELISDIEDSLKKEEKT